MAIRLENEKQIFALLRPLERYENEDDKFHFDEKDEGWIAV
jgi:hypothetical protein